MEQASIFEEHFGQELLTRRRSLLPRFVRIYLWIGIVLSSAIILFSFVPAWWYLTAEEGVNQKLLYLLIGMFAFLYGATVLSMCLAMWLEAKWAILYNIILGGIWLLSVVVLLMSAAYGYLQLILPILSIPYWKVLFEIKEEWENDAIRGKTMQ